MAERYTVEQLLDVFESYARMIQRNRDYPAVLLDDLAKSIQFVLTENGRDGIGRTEEPEMGVSEACRYELAVRLNAFYKDFDHYHYVDSTEVSQTEADVVDGLAKQLADAKALQGVLSELEDIQKNCGLDYTEESVLRLLIKDLKAVCIEMDGCLVDRLADAVGRSKQQEPSNDRAMIDVLQVKPGVFDKDMRYAPLHWYPNGVHSVEAGNYSSVYRTVSDKGLDMTDTYAVDCLLADVFTSLNGMLSTRKMPDGFQGRTLAVSDVIVLSKGNECKAYYRDFVGFKELPEKFVQDYARGQERSQAEQVHEL